MVTKDQLIELRDDILSIVETRKEAGQDPNKFQSAALALENFLDLLHEALEDPRTDAERDADIDAADEAFTRVCVYPI